MIIRCTEAAQKHNAAMMFSGNDAVLGMVRTWSSFT